MAFQFVPNADGGFTEDDKQTNPETNQEYIFTDGAWRALGSGIEGDLTELDKLYLKNEGNNDLDADTNWKITQDSKTLIQGVNGELGLYNLKEPNASHHAATKGYVDTEVRHAGGVTGNRPPGLRFQYKSGSSIPPSGKLGYFTDSGEKRLMISTTSLDFAWGINMPRKDIAYGEGHIFTIWTIQNNTWKMKLTGTLSRIDLHPDRLYAFVSDATDVNGTWSTSASYYITISGMF